MFRQIICWGFRIEKVFSIERAAIAPAHRITHMKKREPIAENNGSLYFTAFRSAFARETHENI